MLVDDEGLINETAILTFTLDGDAMTFQEVNLGTTILFTLGK